MIYEVAHWLGLVPLLWLALLAYRLEARDVAWWWVAGAFGVSWLADSVSHLIPPDVAGNAYPLLQAAIIGAVLLDRRAALGCLGGLALAAIGGVLMQGPEGTDLLLRTAAWGLIVALAYRVPAPFRAALLVTFGGGLIAWYLAAIFPGRETGLLYHGVRLAGVALFCRAATRPGPSLRLETA